MIRGRRREKLNKKNTSWKGNFNILACALPAYLQPSAFARGETRGSERGAEGRTVTRGTGRGAVDFLNTLERFLFVRDSGRHWGITSSFLPGSSGAAPWVRANLIVKPSIGATSMTRKRQQGRIESAARGRGHGPCHCRAKRAFSPSARYSDRHQLLLVG